MEGGTRLPHPLVHPPGLAQCLMPLQVLGRHGWTDGSQARAFFPHVC